MNKMQAFHEGKHYEVFELRYQMMDSIYGYYLYTCVRALSIEISKNCSEYITFYGSCHIPSCQS